MNPNKEQYNELNFPLVDEQHKILLDMIDEFLIFNEYESKRNAILTLNKLFVYFMYHFTYELNVWTKLKQGDLKRHKKEHIELLSSFYELYGDYVLNRVDRGERLKPFFDTWFENHMSGTDHMMMKGLSSTKLEESTSCNGCFTIIEFDNGYIAKLFGDFDLVMCEEFIKHVMAIRNSFTKGWSVIIDLADWSYPSYDVMKLAAEFSKENLDYGKGHNIFITANDPINEFIAKRTVTDEYQSMEVAHNWYDAIKILRHKQIDLGELNDLFFSGSYTYHFNFDSLIGKMNL